MHYVQFTNNINLHFFFWQDSIRQKVKSDNGSHKSSEPGSSTEGILFIESKSDSSATGTQSGVRQTRPYLIKISAPGVAICGACKSPVNYSPTLPKDTVVQCLNTECKRFVCTLDGCWKFYNKLYLAYVHQHRVHHKNADLNKCYFCKAIKSRTGTAEVGQCANCGMYWCLFKNCNYETPEMSSLKIHQGRHRNS